MGASVEITQNEFAEKGVENGTDRMIREACIRIAAQAKTLSPVNKKVGLGGQLKNSIMSKTNYGDEKFNDTNGDTAPASKKISLEPKDTKTEKSGYVGSNVEYATYQEFGTRYMPAQPYLRPAKEIIMDGGKASVIGKKYGQEEMEKEYRRRKVKKKVVNG